MKTIPWKGTEGCHGPNFFSHDYLLSPATGNNLITKRELYIYTLPISVVSFRTENTDFVKHPLWRRFNIGRIHRSHLVEICFTYEIVERHEMYFFGMSWKHLLLLWHQAKYWASGWYITGYYRKKWLRFGEWCMRKSFGRTTPGWETSRWSENCISHRKCLIHSSNGMIGCRIFIPLSMNIRHTRGNGALITISLITFYNCS